MISNLPSESVYAIHHEVKSLTNNFGDKKLRLKIIKDYLKMLTEASEGGVSKIKAG